MKNTIRECRAKDPSTCDYHGAEIRAERALQRGDTDGYFKACRERDANRGVGLAELGALLPTAETATVADIQVDVNRAIVNYPTSSTYEDSWEEEGQNYVGYEEDGATYDVAEVNTYTRYAINGNLANRILQKMGKTDGKVTLTEARIPYWLSEVTSDVDHAFTVEIDGQRVWDSEDHLAHVYPDYNKKDKDSFSLSYIGHLNAWLNS